MGYKSQEGYKIKMIGSFSIGCNSAKFGDMNESQLEIEYEKKRPWIELWGGLLQFGLALFEPKGRGVAEDTGNSIGLEHLEGLRTYFENIESYRRAGRVHELIQEYQKRWPDAKPENLLIEL